MTNDPVYNINDLEKNERILKSQLPESSRRIKEDKTVINFADAITIVDGKPVLKIKNI